jgi:glutaredoxin 2
MSDTSAGQRPRTLALYYYDGCPYCDFVRSVVDELAADVEYRNIMQDPAHRHALIEARGRRTVPVLAITDEAGEVTWMPESRDIISWLRARHAEGLLPGA